MLPITQSMRLVRMNNYNRVVFFGLGRKSDGKLSVKIHLNSREKFLKQSVRVPVINKGQEVKADGTVSVGRRDVAQDMIVPAAFLEDGDNPAVARLPQGRFIRMKLFIVGVLDLQGFDLTVQPDCVDLVVSIYSTALQRTLEHQGHRPGQFHFYGVVRTVVAFVHSFEPRRGLVVTVAHPVVDENVRLKSR